MTDQQQTKKPRKWGARRIDAALSDLENHPGAWEKWYIAATAKNAKAEIAKLRAEIRKHKAASHD